MKKLILSSFAVMLSIAAFAENKTVSFTVNPPLVCNNCENKVKENIRFEKGVKSVKPSAKEGVVVLTYDDSKTDIPAIKEGFQKIGYEATLIEPEVCPEGCAGAEVEECAVETVCCGSGCCGSQK